jgi:hypothetical protein
VLGVTPTWVAPLLGRILTGFGGFAPAIPPVAFALPLRTIGSVGQMSTPLLALGLLLVLGLIPIGFWLARVESRRRESATWGCGRIGQTARMEYTATAFAEPLRRVFAELYRPTSDLSIDFHPESKYFIQAIEYRSALHPWFERVLYDPLVQGLRWTATRVRRLQNGSVHLYLVYMTFVLLVLLSIARWK